MYILSPPKLKKCHSRMCFSDGNFLSVNDYFWCADTILVKCILASFLLILFPGDIILVKVLLTLPKLLIRALLE